MTLNDIGIYLIGKYNIKNTVRDAYNSNSNAEKKLVLDCGCGRGTYSYLFNDEQYVGLDFNISSIGICKKIHPEKVFVVGDATKLPFRDESFENVVCSEVLEHVSNDLGVITEFERITRTPGSIVISVPNLNCNNILVNWQRDLIDEEVGHVRRGYLFLEIMELIGKSKFKMDRIRYSCGPVTALIEFIIIKFGRIFGYNPSDLNQLFDGKKSLPVRICLKVYTLFFPILSRITYLDKLLPKSYRSNMVIIATK